MTVPLVVYDRRMDALHVWLGGEALPSVTYVGDGNVNEKRDPWRREVVIGYEYDHFLSETVYRWPGLARYLGTPGIPRWRAWWVRLRLWWERLLLMA